MRIVLQRVSEASVMIDGELKSKIGIGFLVLLGITQEDTVADIDWLTQKIVGLRVFNDINGAMNVPIGDVGGDILVISQFTLHANTKKGNRPSFMAAARPEQAIPLYEAFVSALSRKHEKQVYTGTFGADMKVSLINDGPVTISIDSLNRE